MANNQIKIAACQLLTSEDVSANTAKVLQQIETCAEREIQIAAFPEGCLFGYCCRTDYWEHISPQVFKEAEAKIAKAARQHGIAVIVGSAHHDGENWHNDLAIFDPQGTLKYRYGKTFLAGRSGVPTIVANYRLWNSLALRAASSSATMSGIRS